MMFRKHLMAAAFGALAAIPLALGTASAAPMGMGHGPMHGMHGGGSPFMMLLRSANLTSDQRAKVRSILQSNRSQMMAMHSQLQDLHEKISDRLLSSGPVTSADLKPLVEQASRIEAKLNQNMADTAVSIRNVLTADQVKHLADVHSKLHNLHSQIQSLMGREMPEDQEN